MSVVKAPVVYLRERFMGALRLREFCQSASRPGWAWGRADRLVLDDVDLSLRYYLAGLGGLLGVW